LTGNTSYPLSIRYLVTKKDGRTSFAEAPTIATVFTSLRIVEI
jgi:hypothetical protein